jgi:hypothetical protein
MPSDCELILIISIMHFTYLRAELNSQWSIIIIIFFTCLALFYFIYSCSVCNCKIRLLCYKVNNKELILIIIIHVVQDKHIPLSNFVMTYGDGDGAMHK